MDRRDIYFFTNSTDDAITTTARVGGKITPELWDPHNGAIANINETGYETIQGQIHTRFPLRLEAVRSAFVVGGHQSDRFAAASIMQYETLCESEDPYVPPGQAMIAPQMIATKIVLALFHDSTKLRNAECKMFMNCLLPKPGPFAKAIVITEVISAWRTFFVPNAAVDQPGRTIAADVP